MLLGREVEHVLVRTAIQVQPANLQGTPVAEALILREHLREDLAKRERDALPHDSHGIHRVHERLGGTLEQTALHVREHRLSPGG